MQQISVLGCGWLGLPLAISLKQKGFTIKGTTTSKDKIAALKSEKIAPYLIQLNQDEVLGAIHSFLEGSRILIINIPPGMKGQNPIPFSHKIKTLISCVENSAIEQVLFVSSTSVFSDSQGEVDEDTSPKPDSESGSQLLKAEQLLMTNDSFKTTVLRFGGLIGEDRHPVNFLMGREDLSGGNAPVNLIHREDCIGIIESIIDKGYWGKIVHGVSPEHPLKKEYYQKTAIKRHLNPPVFQENVTSKYKLVQSKVVFEALQYGFKHTL